jgi:hypothetical protein
MPTPPESPPSEVASRSQRNQPPEVTTTRGTVRLTPTVPRVESTFGSSRRRYEAHQRQLRAERHHTRPEEQQYANQVAIVPLKDTIGFDALPRLEALVSQVKITYCNRAYTRAWLKNLERQNASHFAVLQAIIREIELKDGRDISKADIYRREPDIEQLVSVHGFEIIPSRGQMLRHNGNGIRHAKYAPSKSVAVIWEKIGHTIFVTFDDHAPIRYHRAISHLRDIKVGKPAFPKRPRNTGRFFRNLKEHWRLRYLRSFKGIDLKQRYYE